MNTEIENEERRAHALGFWKGAWLIGVSDGNVGGQGSFWWGKPAGLPCQTSVTVDGRHHGPNSGNEEYQQGSSFAPVRVTIVLSSPATLTRSEEKKTGWSRFIEDFKKKFLSAISRELRRRKAGRLALNKETENWGRRHAVPPLAGKWLPRFGCRTEFWLHGETVRKNN